MGKNVSRRKIGKAILRSNRFQTVAAFMLHHILRGIYKSNRPTENSMQHSALAYEHSPVIFTFWHGQQLLAPYAAGFGKKLVALVSKSADAEINARVLKLAGHDVVRGSGGRVREATIAKGGISATIALKKALDSGRDVGMIADISKSAPRNAGNGVLRLAKMTGRPIVPIAVATSKYWRLEKTWDKTTINLPFGQSCVCVGTPLFISSEASEDELETARLSLNDELNKVTQNAYQSVGDQHKKTEINVQNNPDTKSQAADQQNGEHMRGDV